MTSRPDPDPTDGAGYAPPTAETLRSILSEAVSIAVVGASPNPARPSNDVMRYLASDACGYDVYPVNPNEKSINGLVCYPSLDALPVAPDIVDAFRRAEACDEIAAEAVAAGAGTLWLQLGVFSETAARIARAGGLRVVMDRCTKIDHAQLGIGSRE